MTEFIDEIDYQPVKLDDLDHDPIMCDHHLDNNNCSEDEMWGQESISLYDTASSNTDDVTPHYVDNASPLSENINDPDKDKSFTETVANNNNNNNKRDNNNNNNNNNEKSNRKHNSNSNTSSKAPNANPISDLNASVSVRDVFDWYLDTSDEDDDWKLTLRNPEDFNESQLIGANILSLHRHSIDDGPYGYTNPTRHRSDKPTTISRSPSGSEYSTTSTNSSSPSINDDDDDDKQKHHHHHHHHHRHHHHRHRRHHHHHNHHHNDPTTTQDKNNHQPHSKESESNHQHYHKNKSNHPPNHRLPHQQHSRFNSIYSHTSSIHNSSHAVNTAGNAQYMAGISARPRRDSVYGMNDRLEPQTNDVIEVFKQAAFWGADDKRTIVNNKHLLFGILDVFPTALRTCECALGTKFEFQNARVFLTPTEVKARLVSMTGSTTSFDDRSSPVKYFTHEVSLRRRIRQSLVRHSGLRLASTFFDFCLKNIICIVYIVRVYLDDMKKYECYGSPCGNGNDSTSREELFLKTDVNWYVLFWVHRGYPIWIIEVTLCFISLVRACFSIYIFTKGHRWDQVMTPGFCLEVCCALPMLITLCYPMLLIDLYVPVFLNCWLARKALERIYNNLHLNTHRFQNISVTLAQQMTLLMVSIMCLVFTNMCFIQHIQRASKDTPLSMIDSFYFVIVTFSTVGYGDISPDMWLSRLFMVLMICVAFATIPRQIEGIVSTWMERKRAGGEYSQRSARVNKHVVVCSSSLPQDTVMDFLHEFYAHPKLEEHTVILLCPEELDSSKQVILKDPKWMHRVIYMMGSSLRDVDLQRCRVQQAEACFILAPRPTADKTKADRHTILRSWAVKDFAPQCRQYIQLFRAVNKIHVKFADHIVCEDEFKYALLANNCLYPGLSTLVSLLVHTSSGREGLLAEEPWQQVYGRHSGNEIYHIQLQKSVFFSQYEGESFAAASADAHHRFGVALLAVLDSESLNPRIQLNPGPQYKLKAADFCFYMSVTKEEYSKICPEALKSMPRRQTDNLAQIALALQKYQNESETPAGDDGDYCVFDTITSLMGNNITKGTQSNHNNSMDEADGAGGGCGGGGSSKRLAADKIFSPSPSESSPLSTLEKQKKEDGHCNSAEVSKPSSLGKETGSKEGGDSSVVMERGERKREDSGMKSEEEEEAVEMEINANSLNLETQEVQRKGEMRGSEKGCWKKTKAKKKKSKNQEGLDNVDHRHGAGRVLQFYNDMGQEKLTTGPPPVTIYSGAQRTNCHIMTEPRQHCCLDWGSNCLHCNYKNAKDERWHHQIIILAAQHPSSGIFNFIVPLRSSFLGVNGLSAIVLLLEEEPDSLFVDTMAQFPLVYWMLGSISRVDDLLLAGINKASHLVVVNRASDRQVGGEDILTDSETVVAVQTIFKLFPNTNVITELSQASNMRFMQFNAHMNHQQKSSLMEQKLRNSPNSNLNYIFRLPFAAGHVFSASMLDTLLYQTFVKGYLISFVRLLLGIDAEEGSGHLSSIRVKRATIQKFPEYGQLYEGLCSATGEIPFAIYRTERSGGEEGDENQNKQPSRCGSDTRRPLMKSYSTLSTRLSALKRTDVSDMSGLIRNRLRSLDLSQQDYCATKKRPNTLSYVITNPSPKRKLRVGDIVYVLQPSSMYAKPSKHKLYMGHRSQSHGAAIPDRSFKAAVDSMLSSLGDDVDGSSNPVYTSSPSSKPENVTETKVGRFNLRRIVSERPADDNTLSPISPGSVFGNDGEVEEREVEESRL